MSYLTFMFEIAERKDGLYSNPAWGVTANILFRRTKVRFDLAYAKTGGGEDVDFALRVSEEARSLDGSSAELAAVPDACVVHPFWPGSVLDLASHFFNWAIGDGSLLNRFPEFRYWSFPNFPETLLFITPLVFWFGPLRLIQLVPRFFIADLLVDMSNQDEYRHRCDLLRPLDVPETRKKDWERSQLFYFAAHVLANGYVVVLECGRLWGHLQRPKPWRYICRRFDWHCGRLERAPHNFRRREALKFVLFVAMAISMVFGWPQSRSSFYSSWAYSWRPLLSLSLSLPLFGNHITSGNIPVLYVE